MRGSLSIALALPLVALAVPAAAQDRIESIDPDIDTGNAAGSDAQALARMSRSLADPARQQQLADTLSALTEIVLDLPLAPLVQPLAEAAGEDPGAVDPDMTLRRMAPGAGSLSGEIQDKLPETMDRLAAAGDGIAALVPALREMAARVEEALPPPSHEPR